MTKAIILAAGVGQRIAAGSAGVPKPLLPLDDEGTTFLDWHLRALAMHGVREIYLVGNSVTHGTRVAAMTDVPATWILNDRTGTGSGHSAHVAFTSPHGILDGRSRVVLMDADLVYDPSLFALMGDGSRSKTLVCSKYRETAEEVMVFADEGRPRVHGKGLLGTPLVRGLTCAGEATGILALEPDDHALWLASARWCMSYATAKERSEHEDITQRVMSAGGLEIRSFADDARCMECDTPDEYAVVRTEMVPRWRSALRRTI